MSAALTVNVMPTDARRVVDCAIAAESRGIRRLVLPDSGVRSRDGWVTLGACAAPTSNLRLGLITNPLTRRPEVTALALATLDELTGGRGFAVLSTGGAFQLASMGVDRRGRVDELVDALDVLRRRHPDAEAWVATKGPRTIAAVGPAADAVLLSGIPFALVPRFADAVRAAGARPVLTLHHWFDDESRRDSAERLVYELATMRPEFAQAAGVTADLRDEVLRRLSREGPVTAGEGIPDEVLAAFYLRAPRDDLAPAAAALADRIGVDELVLPERSLLA